MKQALLQNTFENSAFRGRVFISRYLIDIPYGQFVWREQFEWG